MVSLGPGDTKLLTIKALEVLKDVDAICVPTKSSDNSFKKSLTHKIIQKLFKEQNFQKPLIPVYSPMRFNPEDWENEAKTIMIASKKYEKVAFVTLGDSAIYSSVYYILDIIEKEDEKLYKDSLVIPGVTSFSDASAKIKKPICLGDSGFEVKPLLDYEVPKTTIYMRPKIGMDTSRIDEQGDMVTFENLNFEGEKIYFEKIERVKRYMTLFIDFFKRG
jgi:precorrin-2/cobalt-factor-2 C20-methyltransferase